MYKLVTLESKAVDPELRESVLKSRVHSRVFTMTLKSFWNALCALRIMFSNSVSFPCVPGDRTTVRTVCQDDFHGAQRCLVRIWKPRTKTPLLSAHEEGVSKEIKGGGGPGRLYHQRLWMKSQPPWDTSATSPHVGTSSWSTKTHWTNHFP